MQPGKSEYTEAEAARALGVSPAQFRTLLLRHVLEEGAGLSNVGLMRFRPADLLLLGVLSEEDSSQKTAMQPSQPQVLAPES